MPDALMFAKALNSSLAHLAFHSPHLHRLRALAFISYWLLPTTTQEMLKVEGLCDGWDSILSKADRLIIIP